MELALVQPAPQAAMWTGREHSGKGNVRVGASLRSEAGSPVAWIHLLWSYPGEEGVSASSWVIL